MRDIWITSSHGSVVLTAAQIEAIVDEFRVLGFKEVEARRSAFTAITWSLGWSTARIGRYLGVSRARVGQRIDDLRRRVGDPDMPLLSRLMTKDRRVESPWLADMPVAFLADSWRDNEFSEGMLNIISNDQRKAA